MFDKSYSEFYDLFNSKKPYKKEIEFVYRWAGKPRSIFDIGAGTGNYWKYYPKKTDLVGIDRSRAMVDKANDKGRFVCEGDITKYKHILNEKFDCATALFDVLNYISKHDWWANIPVKKGGFFIFDIWDKDKIDRDGFETTLKIIRGATRKIAPIRSDYDSVDLMIEFWSKGTDVFSELHRMYLYSHEDIMKFCGKEFEVVDVKSTKKWQKWYKCKRR